MPIPPPFNPANCQFGSWPSIPSNQMPVLSVGCPSSNQLGYLLSVLRCKTGHTTIYIAPLPGPWTFSTVVRQAVKDVQAFFGQAQTGVVDAACWDAIRLCALS